MNPAKGPLDGLRVFDITQGDGAPFCAMQLGDAGADVIKVEPIEGDWARPLGPPFDHGDGPLFMGMNRNKRSIALRYESPEGREIAARLASGCDVLVESFASNAESSALSLDYDSLSREDADLIYCSIPAFERRGPDADQAGTDLLAQGRAGLPRFVGVRGGAPVRFGTNYAGITAALYAVQAILAALFERKRSGLGQQVSTSYLRALIATQQNYFTSSSDPDSFTGFAASHLGAPSHGWATADGAVDFALGRLREPELITRFMDAFGLQRHGSSGPNPPTAEDLMQMRPQIEAALRRRPMRDVLSVLESFNLMCAPLHDYDSMFHDQGVLEQRVLEQVDHPIRGRVRTSGLPWRLMATPGSVRRAPPLLGEHTHEVLSELGYAGEEIARFEAEGVVLQSK